MIVNKASNLIMDYWRNLVLIAFFSIHVFYFYSTCWHIGSIVAEKCSGTWPCRRRLQHSEHWGHVIDLSDSQWREFRQFIPLFVGVAIASILAERIYQFIGPSLLGNEWNHWTLTGRVVIGLISLLVQHGIHAIVVLVFCGLAYYIPRLLANHKRLAIAAIWCLGLMILVLKESYRFLREPSLYEYLFWLEPLFDQRFGGLYRWQLPANFLALRVISYGIDTIQLHYGESKKDKPDDQLDVEETRSLQSCLAYLLYTPLYIAGPIMTFQSFIRSIRSAKVSINPWIYALRWLLSFLALELLLQRFPVFAIASSGLIAHLSISEVAVVVYLLLKAMWLKFLLLWRFFRGWALFDGVEAPENMLRCMSNNYSLEQFWRGWHSSFNQWLVRYMYIPLGGRTYRYLSVWPIFSFVALWHDAEAHLLVWGVLNAVFFGIESLLKPITGYHKRDELLQMSFTRTILSCVASAGYIMVLMAVNLVGYALGTGGLNQLIAKVGTAEGISVLLFAAYFLSVGVGIMFYLQKIGWVADM